MGAVETSGLIMDRTAQEVVERARAIAKSPDTDPGLRQRCESLAEVWRTELKRSAQTCSEYPTFLTEEDYNAASEEAQRLADEGDEEFEACGERFRRELERFVASRGLKDPD